MNKAVKIAFGIITILPPLVMLSLDFTSRSKSFNEPTDLCVRISSHSLDILTETPLFLST